MIPPGLAAVLQALHMEAPRLEPLRRLSQTDWKETLRLCDRTQLTLPLGDAHAAELPEWVRQWMEENFRKTRQRTVRVRREFSEMADKLGEYGLDFVVLKGFASAPGFVPDPWRRVQYDLDLYLAGGTAARARDVLLGLGYEPLKEMEEFPTDHLPVMIRKTGWQWRGDFYDPEIPVPVDLHFRLWDAKTEGFEAPGWEDFWDRRVKKRWEGIAFGALCEQDAVAYASLHLVRHLLRGSLRMSHVYELGWFLHTRAADDEFWREWRGLHEEGMRQLEAVAFRLAQEWFGCRMAEVAREEVERLPAPVAAWFDRYGYSPLEAIGRPNKHELWLHLSLLTSWRERGAVLRRRLVPLRIPIASDSVFVPESRMTARVRWLGRLRFTGHLLRRTWHHVRVLPSVGWHGALWVWRGSEAGQLTSGYWYFLGSVAVFNLGSFVFFILYNLYLLDLGYREGLLGLVSGGMTVGGVAGTLPAARYIQRVGLGWALASCFGAMAVVAVLRVLVVGRTPLVAFAFAAGIIFSVFAVAVAPAIAQLSTEKTRPRAFSIFFAVGISLGVVGGFLAGRLPALLGSKQAALLVGCGLIGLAAIPVGMLRLGFGSVAERGTFPRGPFIRRFLLVIGCWSLATGAFNPFFNAFFVREVGASVEQVGLIYSSAQLAQVAAILAAPLLLRWAGLVRGVAGMQAACAAALALLAIVPGLLPGTGAAALAYAAYMGFHYMGEPGLYSLLMNRVRREEQGGASSLNHLAMSSAQALAAALSGAAVAHLGYSPVIWAASLIAGLAAVLLWRLIPEQRVD